VADVEALVTLESNQVGAECGGDRGSQRGLSHSRFAFDKQRTPKPQREKQREREATVGHVVLAGQAVLQLRD
jgi:hypothetical protein